MYTFAEIWIWKRKESWLMCVFSQFSMPLTISEFLSKFSSTLHNCLCCIRTKTDLLYSFLKTRAKQEPYVLQMCSSQSHFIQLFNIALKDSLGYHTSDKASDTIVQETRQNAESSAGGKILFITVNVVYG